MTKNSAILQSRIFLLAGLFVLAWAGAALNNPGRNSRSGTRLLPQYGFRVLHVYPHDSQAFTQGLEFRGGFLYEGTGLEGRSTLRREELQTGRVLQEIELPRQFFGEGITVIGERIVQVTWKAQAGFVYQQSSFRLLKTFSYGGEGWGLANDGKTIYMSDGTPQIRCLNAGTLQEERRFTVHEGAQELKELNELEWVNGELFANVWQTDRIVRISPRDGKVLGWIDLTGLLPAADRSQGADVLNGIAYDARGDRLFATGKLWPKLFEIELVREKK
ncbi:MAG: glutaminyl-peptide cyclotransferase [Acidobacteriota bacterium]|nr:glutaminyl-peptide cyclotransferase [Acidobacteriota bacterium]